MPRRPCQLRSSPPISKKVNLVAIRSATSTQQSILAPSPTSRPTPPTAFGNSRATVMPLVLRPSDPPPLSRILVHTTPISLPSTDPLLTIYNLLDTGTTLVYLPDAIVRAYYGSVRGSGYNYAEGGYTYPCSATLPSLTIGIGTYRAVIPGSYITYAPVNSISKDSSCYSLCSRLLRDADTPHSMLRRHPVQQWSRDCRPWGHLP